MNVDGTLKSTRRSARNRRRSSAGIDLRRAAFHICHEHQVAPSVRKGDDRCAHDRGVLQQYALDLIEFDAEPSDFDSPVLAPEVHETTVRAQSPEVARRRYRRSPGASTDSW